jgi:signal transduction histidine kinase
VTRAFPANLQNRGMDSDTATRRREGHDRVTELLGRKVGGLPLTDVLIGVGLTLLLFVDHDWELGTSQWSMTRLPLLLLATAPQALRTTNPKASVALTFVGGVSLLALGVIPLQHAALTISAAISFYTLTRMLSRTQAWVLTVAASALLLAAMLFLSVLFGRGLDFAMLLLPVIIAMFGLTSLTELSRSRGEVAEVRQQGMEQVIAAQREQAAMAERARIAREMHDIVAHSISRIAVEAETAPYTIKDLSDPARQGFEQIATTARETLTEMRRLLGVLRTDGRSGRDTAPQPGLARVPELLAEHRAAGGTVDLDVIGHAVPLAAAVDLSAYRILQEALTNARTHAPGATVRIELAYQPSVLFIRISDDGPGVDEPTDGPSGGHGLVGMRERAVMLGGWLNTGRATEGGFLIEAGLPLDPETKETS